MGNRNFTPSFVLDSGEHISGWTWQRETCRNELKLTKYADSWPLLISSVQHSRPLHWQLVSVPISLSHFSAVPAPMRPLLPVSRARKRSRL